MCFHANIKPKTVNVNHLKSGTIYVTKTVKLGKKTVIREYSYFRKGGRGGLFGETI